MFHLFDIGYFFNHSLVSIFIAASYLVSALFFQAPQAPQAPKTPLSSPSSQSILAPSYSAHTTPTKIDISAIREHHPAASTYTPIIAQPQPSYPEPTTPVDLSPRIQIAGRNLPIYDVSDTIIDSGYGVNRLTITHGKLLYGHNYGSVFGGLASLSPGHTFTITEGGNTYTYQVAASTVVERASIDSPQAMWRIANAQFSYSLALMTCAGQSYGNGDASHRLIIYANLI